MFFTYILKSDSNSSFYIGSCKNISKRLLLHNKLKVRSTKRYAPWQPVYFEVYEKLSDARYREKQIKSWKKREKVAKLIKTFKIS